MAGSSRKRSLLMVKYKTVLLSAADRFDDKGKLLSRAFRTSSGIPYVLGNPTNIMQLTTLACYRQLWNVTFGLQCAVE